LYLLHCNKIYDILGTDVTILGNFNKMKLDTSGYVLIFKDGRVAVAREMKGELSRGEIFVNPCPNSVSSITAMTLGFSTSKLPSHHVYESSGSRYKFIAPAIAMIHAQKTTLILGSFPLMVSFVCAHCSAGKS